MNGLDDDIRQCHKTVAETNAAGPSGQRQDFSSRKHGLRLLFAVLEGHQRLAGLSVSDATGTEVVESDRSHRDRTLPGDDIFETTPKGRISLESLRDSKIVDAIDSVFAQPPANRCNASGVGSCVRRSLSKAIGVG